MTCDTYTVCSTSFRYVILAVLDLVVSLILATRTHVGHASLVRHEFYQLE